MCGRQVCHIFSSQELSESLWQAKRDTGAVETACDEKLKQVQERLEQSISSAKTKALQEAYADHRTLLQQLFPEVSVKDCDDGKQQQWLEEFESKAQESLSSTKEAVRESTSLGSEGSTVHIKRILVVVILTTSHKEKLAPLPCERPNNYSVNSELPPCEIPAPWQTGKLPKCKGTVSLAFEPKLLPNPAFS